MFSLVFHLFHAHADFDESTFGHTHTFFGCYAVCNLQIVICLYGIHLFGFRWMHTHTCTLMSRRLG